MILKNDKTIIAYHFGQYLTIFKKNEDYLKLKLVLRNGCFHNGPVICTRLSHNGLRRCLGPIQPSLDHYD